jgi:hypothetical protein
MCECFVCLPRLVDEGNVGGGLKDVFNASPKTIIPGLGPTYALSLQNKLQRHSAFTFCQRLRAESRN